MRPSGALDRKPAGALEFRDPPLYGLPGSAEPVRECGLFRPRHAFGSGVIVQQDVQSPGAHSEALICDGRQARGAAGADV